MEWVIDYDYEILYKSGKENVIINVFSYIHINTLSSLSNNIIWKSFITEYWKNSFKNLIKEMKKKKEIYIWYMIENKLLYYRIDEYESWRFCISNISYQNMIIYENHDLSITDHSDFVQIYNKIARSYYWSGMSKDIWKYVKECDACQRMKISNKSFIDELHLLSISQ